MFWYSQAKPFSAQRVHRGVRLSHRLLLFTQAWQLFCLECALVSIVSGRGLTLNSWEGTREVWKRGKNVAPYQASTSFFFSSFFLLGLLPFPLEHLSSVSTARHALSSGFVPWNRGTSLSDGMNKLWWG
jgi:hypothetical protein